MIETKMLKAKCKKTDRYFGLELRNISGTWKVINMIDLDSKVADVIQSEVSQEYFDTNENLLPCKKCGSRRVGGCSCAKKATKCRRQMDYNFQCIYCDELEIDYSLATGSLPYSKWAGVSNIPDAIKDKYGNPKGSEYDLIQDGALGKYTIVVLKLYKDFSFDAPEKALKKKGFKVVTYDTIPPLETLKSHLRSDQSQLWIVSNYYEMLSAPYIQFIKEYYESGHGLYIWGDNQPYYADANKILNLLFGVQMYGNSDGDKVLGIQKKPFGPGIIANHKITTGIQNFYEGITIAEILPNNKLTPLIYGSNGKIVTSYFDQDGRRALIDGGFTRLYHKWDSAGTDRYVVNAAAWLCNFEKFGYKQ